MSNLVMRLRLNDHQQQLFPGYFNGLRANFSQADFKTFHHTMPDENSVVKASSTAAMATPTLGERARNFILGSPPKEETFAPSSKRSSSVDGSSYPFWKDVECRAKRYDKEEKEEARDKKMGNKQAIKTRRMEGGGRLACAGGNDFDSFNFNYVCAQAIVEIAQLHTSSYFHKLLSGGFIDVGMSNDDVDVDDEQHNHSMQQRRAKEKLLLLMRCLQLLNSTLHTIRNRVDANQLQLDSRLKKLIVEINTLYKMCLTLSAETSAKYESLSEGSVAESEEDCCTVDSMILGYAVRECQAAVMEEMDEFNMAECVARYEKSLILLNSLLATCDSIEDREQIENYVSKVMFRMAEAKSAIMT